MAFTHVNTGRRTFIKAIAGAGTTIGLSGCLGSSGGGDWPSETITVIVPYPEGGGTDTQNRALMPILSDVLDNPVALENVPGAGGLRAFDEAMSADPDGYTVLAVLPPSGGILPNIIGLEESQVDMTEVKLMCGYARTPYVIHANPSHEIEDLDHMLDLYSDGEFTTVGVGSVASPPWVQAGVMKLNDMNWYWEEIVPYGGSGPTNEAVVSNEVPVGISTPVSILDFVDQGDLVPIAHTTSTGSQTFPDVDSVTDYGYPNIDMVAENLRGHAVPPETDEAIIESWIDAMSETLETDEAQQWSDEVGLPLELVPREDVRDTWFGALETLPEEIDVQELRSFA